MPECRQVQFATAADVIADVERLRRGPHETCGQWSFEQICWHLDRALRAVMTSGPRTANTPEQVARRSLIESILRTGKLPGRIDAPEGLAPPAEPPPSTVNDWVENLRVFAAHAGPFGPYRLFGNLADDEMRRLVLVHCAHHLSHVLPAAAGPAAPSLSLSR